MNRNYRSSDSVLRNLRLPVPSRRAFLRGAAATLALPLLPSALPRATWGSELARPTRLLFYYVPNGIQDPWTPTTFGADYDLTEITAPLEPVKAHVSLLTGLASLPAEDIVPGDHARGTGAFLTGVKIKRTSGSDIDSAVSVDQLAANAAGGESLFRSLQIGIQPGGNTGDCTAGYSCAYTRNISWADDTTPLPNITDPGLLFDRLFGVDQGLPPEIERVRRLSRASILDQVLTESESLSTRLGQADREKLDQYLTAVREVEVRVNSLGGGACGSGDRPNGDVAYAERVALMQDLIVTAFQCDLTRIVTFMLGEAASNQSYDFIGVPGSHHEISHHQGDATKLAQLRTIARWEVQQFADLVQRLAETPDGEGSLVDSTLAFWSSEIRDGNDHTHRDLPVLLAGGGNGAHLGGVHRVYDAVEPRPVGDLLLTMLHAFGVDVDQVGDDGQTPLEDLAADG
ncbi:MAG: DUF1552 domain-containing protein [Myxococcota bacterium]